jgi:hypothetical protein
LIQVKGRDPSPAQPQLSNQEEQPPEGKFSHQNRDIESLDNLNGTFEYCGLSGSSEKTASNATKFIAVKGVAYFPDII